jgi:hypothetical protein
VHVDDTVTPTESPTESRSDLSDFNDFMSSLKWLPQAVAEVSADSFQPAPTPPALAVETAPFAWTPLPQSAAIALGEQQAKSRGRTSTNPAKTANGAMTPGFKKALLALGLTIVVAGGLAKIAKASERKIPPHPAQFDAQILPMASFIERETGKPFKYPISILFVPDDRFESLSILNDSGTDSWKSGNVKDAFLSCSDGRAKSAGSCDPIRPHVEPSMDAMFLRFLGANIPIEGRGAGLYRSLTKRDIIGFYDPKTITIYVRGTNLDSVRETVAHELVHAWQDQHGALDKSKDGIDSSYVHLAMVEGHADLVAARYLDSLPKEAQEAVALEEEAMARKWEAKEQAASAEGGSVYDETDGDGRKLELSLGIWPYEAGQEFLASRSPEQIRELLNNPPASTWDVMNPTLDGVGRGKKTGKPKVPKARYTPKNHAVGPLFWTVGLASTLDSTSAKRFRDLWIGDSSAVYEDKATGSVCFADRIEFIDSNGRATAQAILSRWAAAHPASRGVSVVPVKATEVDVRVCI